MKIFNNLKAFRRGQKTRILVGLGIIGSLAVAAGLMLFFGGKETEAAWWDESWLYRQIIPITNPGSTLTDYQISFTLDTASLITNGKMKSDCADIRITDLNGNLLPYWIEENNPGCNNANTRIWTKVSSIHSSGTTLFLYYGNPTANNVSRGKDVFPFFEDFNSPTLDTRVWSATDNYSLSNNTITITTGAVYTNDVVSQTPQNLHFEMKAKYTAGAYAYSGINIANAQTTTGSNSTSKALAYNMTQSGSGYNLTAWGADGTTTGYNIVNNGAVYSQTLNTDYIIGYTFQGTSNIKYFVKDLNYADLGTNTPIGTWNEAFYLWLGYFTGSSAGTVNIDDIEVDWVRTRKYAAAEPVVGTLSSEEVGPGPVAYWKFDEGEGTTAHDSTRQGNHGSFTGSPTWQAENQCISGKCLSFNGSDDWITVPNNEQLKFVGSDFTISLWAKPATKGNHVFIGKGRGTQREGYRIYTTSTTIRFMYSDTYEAGDQTIIGPNYNADEWMHLTLTANKTLNEIEGFVNGVSVGTMDITGFSEDVSGNFVLEIGRNGAYSINGLIDEVKIYPYVRTGDQIISEYENLSKSVLIGQQPQSDPDTARLPTPTAYWKFDEGYGGTAYNSGSSGSASNGNLGGTAQECPASGDVPCPTWTNNGKVGKALSFDGNDYVLLPGSDIDNLASSGDFTITAWNNQPSFSGAKAIAAQAYGGHSFGRWLVGTTSSNGFISLYGGTSSPTYKQVVGTKTLPSNQWFHITAVFSRTEGKIKLYIDGLFDNEVLWDGHIELMQSDKANIGYNARSTPTHFMVGLTDEVKFYNTALTEGQIRMDMNRGASMVMGATGTDASGNPLDSASAEYCIPGDDSYCEPPVTEWKLDEGQGLIGYDTSNNTYNTTIVGANWTNGKIGKALSFNGVNSHTYFDKNILNNKPAISVSAWFKTTDSSGSVVSQYQNSSGYSWQLNVRDGLLKACVGTTNSDSTCRSNTYQVSTSTNVNDGKWRHGALVYNGSHVYLFIDGRLVDSAEKTGNIYEPTGGILYGYIGLQGYDTGSGPVAQTAGYLNGIIDQVRLFDYARTPAQIAWEYNRGAPIGHWKFDECQGSTAHDSSGNGNHGTINIGGTGSQTSTGTCQTSGTAWGNGASGRLNASLNFDGTDDYVDISGGSQITGSNPFTLAAWVNVGTYRNQYTGALSIGTNSSGQAAYIGQMNNNNLGGGFWGANYNTGITPTIGKWYHLVQTFSGGSSGTVKIYVNGEEKVSQTYTPNISSSYTRIGAIITNPYWFNGKIDDARIYNYALTPQQIQTLYNDGAIKFGP